MNEQEITACEFSKEHDDSIIAYHAAKDVINFLLRRFCLVEKSKIKGHYIKYMQQFCDTRDIAAKEYAAGCISTLDILFPEIAEEVEDEES